MEQNPILKVLSVFNKNRVKYLLIGGQASILYGAIEFSRDTDFFILCDTNNIKNVRKALKELKAEIIYVPSFSIKYLLKGQACHFRCHTPETEGLRIDFLGKMRGCADFTQLWDRRTTVKIGKGNTIEMLGLRDLVESKKTQRDKDWLMIKRLVDNDILITKKPERDKVIWWLKECRTIEKLKKLCIKYRMIAKEVIKARPVLREIFNNNIKKAEELLTKEEKIERKKDYYYWQPLLKELEMLRHS